VAFLHLVSHSVFLQNSLAASALQSQVVTFIQLMDPNYQLVVTHLLRAILLDASEFHSFQDLPLKFVEWSEFDDSRALAGSLKDGCLLAFPPL